ncbi:MAG: hypothetical protein DME87_11880 [Verrucomicrobia bacterium]|nr:MAG: hypothetical protein DME87_11880 [Verrucomicrobiota bacterium]
MFAIEIRNGQKIFPMHPPGHKSGLPTNNMLALFACNKFCGLAVAAFPSPTVSPQTASVSRT